ncbi:MAG TPA: NAD(P)/FAD-dependent oxidoreductase, partial [Steroidobacteraceae bacterium]|nr:NAD(P)/FAD-dependent oxidoreductase [Steroidobacteraceae bacterium]
MPPFVLAMHEIDTVVIGAGVIGLAIARALAQSDREVLILEALDDFGTETSARNSEVIHAGIYYPQGSLKARLCVAGREKLYAFSETYGVNHRRCGKLIVATATAQLDELKKIQTAAHLNGVELELIEKSRALAMEPNLSCVGALWSPVTGIIDSHAYMLALLGQAEGAGATLACRSRVTRGWIEDGVQLAINDESEPSLHAKRLINCAGLYAPKVVALLDGFPRMHVPQAYFAKANYFTLGGRAPFSRLVYPVPEPGGLGVHLTLDLGGQARFGPDVEWIEQPSDPIDYAVDPARGEKFYAAIRKYWPALPDGALAPAYSGMRPKISG